MVRLVVRISSSPIAPLHIQTCSFHLHQALRMDRPSYRSGREGIDAGPDKTSQAKTWGRATELAPVCAWRTTEIEAGPDKTSQAKTRGRATDLLPVCAWRTPEQVRHADAKPAKAGRAPQAWAASKIDSPAPLPDPRAEKRLSENPVGYAFAAGAGAAVVPLGSVDGRLRCKCWYVHNELQAT
jgi:hypothetical protein